MTEQEIAAVRAWLRKLTGYVENGTSDIATISQDDATMWWFARTRYSKISLRSDSLNELIEMVGNLPDLD